MSFVSMVLVAAFSSPGQTTDDELRARAERLPREAIVLDTHADLTPFIEKDTKQVERASSTLGSSARSPTSF